jgi:hypothetical protein
LKVKLSSLGPLMILLSGTSVERVLSLSCAKLGRGQEDVSEFTDVRRDRGEEGENTAPGKVFEMNK